MPSQLEMHSQADDPIGSCLAGRISPSVMLARLVLSGLSDSAIERALLDYPGGVRLLTFFHAHVKTLPQLRATVARVDHTRGADPACIAAQFDAAVTGAPEASVAVYSLGEPDLLASATTEVVDWLKRQSLFTPGMDVLDLGCGFGRIAAALVPQAASVLGLDISPRMVAEAQRRFGQLPHLHFAVTSGTGLVALPDGAFDLVLAVDSFPYLLQSGDDLAHRHVRDIARVLRPGGCLAVLNLSYGRDPEGDSIRIAAWAAQSGMSAEVFGDTPLRIWDARAYVFARQHGIVRGEAELLRPRFDAGLQRSEGSH